MKILTVSDVVEPSLYPVVDAGRHTGINLILACGDLPPEYLSFLSNYFNVPLYYVCGNHDIRYNRKRPMGCTDVHARLVPVLREAVAVHKGGGVQANQIDSCGFSKTYAAIS